MVAKVPFGGAKQSRHSRLGLGEGLAAFLQPQNIWINPAPPEA